MEKNLIQINGRTMINLDVSVKNIMYVKKDYIWNLATRSCKHGKYLANIMDDSTIIRDEFIQIYNKERKAVPANFNEKKETH